MALEASWAVVAFIVLILVIMLRSKYAGKLPRMYWTYVTIGFFVMFIAGVVDVLDNVWKHATLDYIEELFFPIGVFIVAVGLVSLKSLAEIGREKK